MRVLVTGAHGFIGRALVPRLEDSGHEVIAFVRSAGAPVSGVRQVLGDITDSTSLERAVHDVDAVVHLAALKSDEPESYAVNVSGMRNLISACKKAGVDTIIYVSTASAKIKHPGVYGTTKKEAEEILMKSGLRPTILRPSLVYGESAQGAFSALVKAARLPVIPVFGDGTWLSHPIHVDDVAHAVEMVLTNNALQGRIYDVGGPEKVSFDDLLHRIRRDILQRPRPRILHISPRIGFTLARTLRLFMRRPPFTESNILGSTQNIAWNRETFFRDSGFTPRSLAEGFRTIIRNEWRREVDILYAYIYSRSGFHISPSQTMQKRYQETCSAGGLAPMHPLLMKTPVLIGPLDAATKLFYPKSPFRNRLLIASALIEADPRSAPWLYPRARTRLAFFVEIFFLSLSASIKIITGSLLALVPGFLKTYAR